MWITAQRELKISEKGTAAKMKLRNRMFIKFAALAITPVVLIGFSSGPPQRRTGAPGDQTCIASGCHTGTVAENSPGLVLEGPTSNSYTPGGAAQTWRLRITQDGARVFGFQASTRPESDETNGQAGTFGVVANTTVKVICQTGNDRPAGGCTTAAPLEFIQHSTPIRATDTATFEFTWTPPATNVGNVSVYLIANGSLGGRTNSRIMSRKITLAPGGSGGGGQRPAISSGGLITAAAFGGGTTIAAGSWMEIYGTNFATSTREWAGSDFNGNNAPTSLDGVSATVSGRPAYVRFVSPGQVNVQAPADIGAGMVPVVVRNAAGESTAVMINAAPRASGIFAPFRVNNVTYSGAIIAGVTPQTFAAPTGIAGVVSRPARVGETMTLFMVGMGATTPATPPGVVVTAAQATVPNVLVRLDDTPATVSYAGTSQGAIGLYQINFVIPNVATGDRRVNITVDGTPLTQMVMLPVGQ
jgi:uncharacterized protein (TIGR03437 family)